MICENKFKQATSQIKGHMLDSYEEACRKSLIFYDTVVLGGHYQARAEAYKEMYVMICENLSDENLCGDEDE